MMMNNFHQWESIIKFHMMLGPDEAAVAEPI